jgi:hypothetical protein
MRCVPSVGRWMPVVVVLVLVRQLVPILVVLAAPGGGVVVPILVVLAGPGGGGVHVPILVLVRQLVLVLVPLPLRLVRVLVALAALALCVGCSVVSWPHLIYLLLPLRSWCVQVICALLLLPLQLLLGSPLLRLPSC